MLLVSPNETPLKVISYPSMEAKNQTASSTYPENNAHENGQPSPISSKTSTNFADTKEDSCGGTVSPVSPLSEAAKIESQQQRPSSYSPRARVTSKRSEPERIFSREHFSPAERDNPAPPEPAPRNTFVRGLSRVARFPWLLEILSCLVATAALSGIVITLLLHQGRPLPQWPSMISINSLVAIFSAIFKAAILLPVAEGKREPLLARPQPDVHRHKPTKMALVPQCSLLGRP